MPTHDNDPAATPLTQASATPRPDGDSPSTESHDAPKPDGKRPKRHLIRPRWLRVTLKTLIWIVIAVLMIPVLLYIPPVQTLVKDIACDQVSKATGMKIEIDRFRLKWPVDVSLQGVSVLDVSGDTMVRAREAIVDVRLRPLLELDVRIKRLLLLDGYYRMVSPDSSMILTVDAGRLEVDDKSFADIRTSEISLNKARLANGRVSLFMDVWRKKPQPVDTAPSTPFLIKANDLQLDNFTFAMSMLPTIDTLRLETKSLRLQKGVVDLRSNNISAALLAADDGKATYIAPDPAWAAAHPAPVDTVTPPSPPIRITGDSVSLAGFKALYAIKGAKPLPGFDASYISVSDVNIGMRGFFNEASTVLLPITRLQAVERSGLRVNEGSGTVRIDSTGLALAGLNVRTPYSSAGIDADIPFALMELKPSAPVNAKARASIGIPDIEAFMPSLKTYTKPLPRRDPLTLAIEATGTLASVKVARLDAAIAGFFSLRAKGKADNALNVKKLVAALDFDGELRNPKLAEEFTGPLGFDLPPLSLKGSATADRGVYGADFGLRTPAGDLAAKGRVGLNSESYTAEASVRSLNVARFIPDLGIGEVSADISAEGSGFNPVSPRAHTDIRLDLLSIFYNGHHLTDIHADARLRDGAYEISAVSPNPLLDFDLNATGTVADDDYGFDIAAHINNADLRALGLMADECAGRADLYLTGTASPGRWLYDADLKVNDVQWNLPGQYINIPHGLSAHLTALPDSVDAHVESYLTYADFRSGAGLKPLIDGLMSASDSVTKQITDRRLDVAALRDKLPPFHLRLNASGRGLVSEFLSPSGMSVDTIYADLVNDSVIKGRIGLNRLVTSSLTLDTVTLGIKQRGQLLDYRAHLGNRKGTLDEFATVNVNGYIGENRAALSLTQKNIQGETGYRVGLTAGFMPDRVELHFTPLRATIAYLPWNFNPDNHVEYNFNGKINANLLARSNESSILMMTEPGPDGADQLHVNLDNIRIQDFLKMSVFAPPLTASIDSDIRVSYTGSELNGKGTLSIHDFTYDKVRVGDFDLEADAGMDLNGRARAEAALKIDGKKAMAFHTVLVNDSTAGMKPEQLGLTLTQFPLSVANPFLGADVAQVRGSLNGSLDLSGTFSEPLLNGSLACDSVGILIPMAGTTLRLDREPITVTDNVIAFNKFDITAVNANPLTIDGRIDARKFSDISFDLTAKGNDIQLVGTDRRARTDIYGKLFMNLDASVKGPMKHFDLRANANILGTTDLFYNLPTSSQTLMEQNSSDVVKFVEFRDSTQMACADSVAPSSMAMRIIANLTITPGTQVTVNLSNNGTDKAQLLPSGTLNYFQNFMGDMRLTGQLNTGAGFARYSLPVAGEKSVTLDPSSFILWNGNVMNPTLNVKAVNITRANVQSGGNSRLVNFNIGINVTNTLSAPRLAFTLACPDDMTVENEITSMSPDQRSSQAMNLLIYNTYTGPGTTTDRAPSTAMLYSYLSSQLNSWAAKTIKGVDLSFGINQYDKITDGQSSTAMSYSYQVSKSLFNNRFRIVVGGNYATDASADENLSENLISDISFEYMIKQTQSMSMLVKLFRHNGYESILEGEVTETGVGFVMKRKLGSLRSFFRNPFGIRRRRVEPADTVQGASQAADSAASRSTRSSDSTVNTQKK